ncbi:MAG: Fur family transcriptional regulator [Planctomycetota bacterium]|jgi:Fur family ferric uptake transcriptional regulator
MPQPGSASSNRLPSSIQELKQHIRDGGLRATPCRIAVLRLLEDQTAPLSHSDAVDHLSDRGFDQSTVYRTLNDLADAGLLSRLELGDHVWRYELPEHNGVRASHPHHLCEDCGRITCLSGVSISLTEFDAPAARVGSVREVLLKGVCVDCQPSSKDLAGDS